MGKALYEVGAEGRWLRGAVLGAVGLGLVLPIVLGLAQTALAAFGIFPALGFRQLSLTPWRMLADLPGVMTSLRLTVLTGVGSTLIALLLATSFCATVHARITPQRGARWLAPFLAAPHAAMAIGVAFLIAPSGLIARAGAVVAGWDRPPAIASVNDELGLALTLGLVVKEMPFLLLVILSALSQIDVRRNLAVARSLGYGRGVAWIKVIMPLVWPLIRLPVYVVFTYALSTVDMAIILGPSNPPTLAVAIARWYSDPDPAMFLPASAGAILQGLIVCRRDCLLPTVRSGCHACWPLVACPGRARPIRGTGPSGGLGGRRTGDDGRRLRHAVTFDLVARLALAVPRHPAE